MDLYGALIALDRAAARGANRFVHRSAAVDTLIHAVSIVNLVKFIPFMMILWALWFETNERDRLRRIVARALTASALALFVSRVVQNFAPHRPRPMHDAALALVPPFGLDPARILVEWSSFPSDHAALAFALVVPLFAVRRSLGVVTVAWVLLLIMYPRLHTGYHYPSDLVAGAMLGAAAVEVVRRSGFDAWAAGWASRLAERRAAEFYALAFAGTYLLGTMFDDVRKLGAWLRALL